MNYLSIFLLAILAVAVFSTEMETKTKIGGGQRLESNNQMDSGMGGGQMEANSEVHNRQRRWGYGGYGGYGMGYGGMGYGRMGYGGYGGYGGYYG